jgi:sigma-E factor negative regulatory protein RseA
MIQEKKQRVSALVDGEYAGASADLVADVAGDDELRGVWERYHLIGQALRGENIDPRAQSTAGALAPTLDAESALIRVPGSRWGLRGRIAPVAGAVLATAAALLAMVSVPPLFQGLDIAPGRAATVADRGWVFIDDARRWREQPPALSSKLDRLVVNHQAAVPSVGMDGMLSYAALVGHGGGR